MRIPASGSLRRAATCSASRVPGQAAGSSIIQNWMGVILAENLVGRFGSRVQPVTIANQVKERMVVEFRVGLEKRNIRHYPDRERIGHLHSVKKVLLPRGSTRYDTARNERHHADKAWSQILAYCGVSSAPKIDFSHLGCVGRRESAKFWEYY